ncbi:hypothetical protein FACS189475_10380 [Betaproteobacteria bacterium]|nr:hypothetical protein FACS189475_10380 [Betaproteobacteria bacterium]
MTEHAYDNSKFVEDMVRDVALVRWNVAAMPDENAIRQALSNDQHLTIIPLYLREKPRRPVNSGVIFHQYMESV